MDRVKQQNKAYMLLEDALKYPGLANRSMITKKIRLWVYPSFEPFVSWTVFGSGKEFFARRVIWDQRKVVLTEEPQTFGAEVRIDESVIEEIQATLGRLELKPFIPVNTLGIDGTAQGVEYGGHVPSAKLSWWGEPEQSWEPLANWLNKYIGLVNNLFPSEPLEIPTALTKQ